MSWSAAEFALTLAKYVRAKEPDVADLEEASSTDVFDYRESVCRDAPALVVPPERRTACIAYVRGAKQRTRRLLRPRIEAAAFEMERVGVDWLAVEGSAVPYILCCGSRRLPAPANAWMPRA